MQCDRGLAVEIIKSPNIFYKVSFVRNLLPVVLLAFLGLVLFTHGDRSRQVVGTNQE